MSSDHLQAIILAAGRGERLGALTATVPKPLMSLCGHNLIDYTLDALAKARCVSALTVATGHCAEKLKDYVGDNKQVTYSHNPEYESTNMVSSFFRTRTQWLDDVDLLVIYGDIVFDQSVLLNLLSAKHDGIQIVSDHDWQSLWKIRMENPLEDVESFKYDGGPKVKELGAKVENLADIEGQFIGMIKIPLQWRAKMTEFYERQGASSTVRGRQKAQWCMTDFLQLLIDNGFPVFGVPITGGWCEVDTLQDLMAYQDACREGRLEWLVKRASL